MKQWFAITLSVLLAIALTACGCQNSNMGSSTTQSTASTTQATEPSIATTDPIVDPTILDPTFETNIPDDNVNENSTSNTLDIGETIETRP